MSSLLVLVLSGFVMAGSEISTNFVIVDKEAGVEERVYSKGLGGSYGDYIVGILIILIIVFAILKTKIRKKLKKVKKKIKKVKKK